MNEFTLSTGRKVYWQIVPGKGQRLDIRYGDLPDGQLISDDERREAAAKINEVLHPDKEKFNAA